MTKMGIQVSEEDQDALASQDAEAVSRVMHQLERYVEIVCGEGVLSLKGVPSDVFTKGQEAVPDE